MLSKPGMEWTAKPRALVAHERVAQEVGEVAAEQGEHEADGDLRLSQGDAAEGHDQSDRRPDEPPRR